MKTSEVQLEILRSIARLCSEYPEQTSPSVWIVNHTHTKSQTKHKSELAALRAWFVGKFNDTRVASIMLKSMKDV